MNMANGTVALSCVAVYCGSSKGTKPEYAQKASARELDRAALALLELLAFALKKYHPNDSNYRSFTVLNMLSCELAKCLVEHNIEVVYGGSRFGLMGSLADSVILNGGTITGIIPKFFTEYDGHEQIGKQIVVPDMHTRKMMIFEKADAFIALPGGLGTMEELTEILTWSKINIHTRPVGLLNTLGYYDSFIEWIKKGIKDGFIPGSDVKDVLIVESEPYVLVEKLIYESQQRKTDSNNY